MTKYIHAELMVEYAKDAMLSETPWKYWEYRGNLETQFHALTTHPAWYPSFAYRRKSRTLSINGYEVPYPEVSPLNDGQVYYKADLHSSSAAKNPLSWVGLGNSHDNYLLYAGLIHLTPEAAEIHSKALQSFFK